MNHSDIISFLMSPPDIGWLSVIKTMFITFSLFLVVVVVYFTIKTSWLKVRMIMDVAEFFTYKPHGSGKAKKQWVKISSRVERGLESEYKLAVLEADSIIDEVLKKMGYGGDSLGERLQKVKKDILPNIDEVMEAHKIRNNIVHDPDYKLSQEEAKDALSVYEKALVDLGFL